MSPAEPSPPTVAELIALSDFAQADPERATRLIEPTQSQPANDEADDE